MTPAEARRALDAIADHSDLSVDGQRRRAEAEAALQDAAVETTRAYVRLLTILDDCPLGHAGSKVVLHRSTTEADVVSWLELVYAETRKPDPDDA